MAKSKEKKDPTSTPMMRQYLKIKNKNRDKLVLFRLGDFYELFMDDAKTASRELNLTLTARHDIPMCGMPHHSIESYVAKLIRKGYKVAMCDQVEDPKKTKTIVRREVTSVITPGTVTNLAMLSEKENNFLFTVFLGGNRISAALADLSTGDFFVSEDDHSNALEFLDNLNAHFPASEVLACPAALDEPAVIRVFERASNPVPVTAYEEWNFEPANAEDRIKSQFGLAGLKSLGLEDLQASVRAAGAALSYLQETQKQALQGLKRVKPYSLSSYMLLDSTTIRNLELVKNSRDGGLQGSLLSVLDRTCTAMGGRLLRTRMVEPLLDQKKIENRLDRVEHFYQDSVLRSGTMEKLGSIQDMERLMTRVSLKKATPRDTAALCNSLKQAKDVFQGLGPAGLYQCPDPSFVYKLISETLQEDPSLNFNEGRVIREGVNADLDKYRESRTKGRKWILELEVKERERTGISSLKIKFNNVFGYYYEVTNTNLKKVPDDYIRKQTLSNAERFINQKLQEYESLILGASEKMEALEKELFFELLDKINGQISVVQETSSVIARIDIDLSLAHLAREKNYSRPEIKKEGELKIREGRHPVVEHLFTAEDFIPNDLNMDLEENTLLLITGPNMAGKSTYLRQNALIVLMAQIGSFVPASSAQVVITDKIFTRVGASDNLVRGESTFLVEMQEAANILHNATERSLIIMDEIGRGTSTYDGLSIAWSVVEYIQETLRCKTLFATHYHELTVLDHMKGIKNYNILVREWKDDIIFLRKIAPGTADKSYGIQVAKLAGLPGSIVSRAKQILLDLETDTVREIILEQKKGRDGPAQLPLFSSSENPLLHALKDLDPDNLTPLEALTVIQKWKKEYGS